MKKILSNKARCLDCNTIVESQYRHDFKHCPCGNLAVDGGKDYARRLFKNPANYEELTEYEGD